MTRRISTRQIGLGLSVILILFLVFWGWERNSLALEVRAACLDAASGLDVPAGNPWLDAVLSNCTTDQVVLSIWESALDAFPSRISVVRAATDDNLALAQFAVEHHPQNAAAFSWLAESLEENDEVAGALQAYVRVVQLQPVNAEAWVSMGNLYAQQKNKDAALTAYERACELVDLGRNGCYRAGHIYLDMGQYQTALERYEMTNYQLGYPLPGAELGRARALIGLGKLEQARAILLPLAEKGDQQAQKLLNEIVTTP